MSSRRGLARQLSALEGFDAPDAALEQYATPADLAAHVVHLADLQDDLADRTVVDLGSGTGILAIGAAIRGARCVVGVERDPKAITIARENARALDVPNRPSWLRGDATRPPLCVEATTILMNPPFGAQTGREHADRAFLETAAEQGAVSYSIHNAGSREFLTAFVEDHGAALTHVFATEIPIERAFEWHTADEETIEVVVVRIDWSRATRDGTSPGSRSEHGSD